MGGTLATAVQVMVVGFRGISTAASRCGRRCHLGVVEEEVEDVRREEEEIRASEDGFITPRRHRPRSLRRPVARLSIGSVDSDDSSFDDDEDEERPSPDSGKGPSAKPTPRGGGETPSSSVAARVRDFEERFFFRDPPSMAHVERCRITRV